MTTNQNKQLAEFFDLKRAPHLHEEDWDQVTDLGQHILSFVGYHFDLRPLTPAGQKAVDYGGLHDVRVFKADAPFNPKKINQRRQHMTKIKKLLTMRRMVDGHKYQVIKAVNILEPAVKSIIPKREVLELIESGVQVTIVGDHIR